MGAVEAGVLHRVSRFLAARSSPSLVAAVVAVVPQARTVSPAVPRTLMRPLTPPPQPVRPAHQPQTETVLVAVPGEAGYRVRQAEVRPAKTSMLRPAATSP